jgi:hypothetical protein
MCGAAGRAIQELVGHQDLTMTQRYMHLSTQELDSTIRLLDRSSDPPSGGNIVETAMSGTQKSSN